MQTLLQSLISLGALAACIIIFKFGGYISPRVGIWLASAISAVSITMQIASTDIAALYVGRILLGFANGFYSTYSAIYIGESAPAFLRGAAVGMVILQINIGAVIGILVDNYTQIYATRKSYQIPLGVMFAIPVAISIGLLFLPETPRYYITKGQYEKAASAIRRLRGVTDEAQLAEEVEVMKKAWLEETRLNSSVQFKDAFRGIDLRRTLLSVSTGAAQASTGMYFMSNFSVYFFVQAGIQDSFTWVMVTLAIAITGNMLAFPAARFIDRRYLLIGASIMNALAQLAIAIIYTVTPPGSTSAGKALVGLSIIFVWMYGVGQGPVLWALQTEIPSQRLRAQTVGLSQCASFLTSWLSAYCSPYFINPEALNWGPKYCFIWAGSNLILATFVFFFIPETKGRSLEQLDELFDKRLPAWKFKGHVTDLQQPDADGYVMAKDKMDLEDASRVEHRE